MKINIYETKVICENKDSLHGYFGWPSVAKLQDGSLAMVASGFRYAHVCPFGKGIISYSKDEGKTWSKPMVLIDTPIDDRDCGICTFGENGVIVTCLHDSVSFHRGALEWKNCIHEKDEPTKKYISAYLDIVEKRCKDSIFLKYPFLSTFKLSYDGGKTFEDVTNFIPITSPHGPCILPDGDILYIGKKNDAMNSTKNGGILSYLIHPDKSIEKIGEIEYPTDGLNFYEPHAIVSDGKVVVHLRAERKGVFTIFQCESYDYGKTFTKPHQILADKGGAPAHIIKYSDKTLISLYGYREKPYGIRAMFSNNNGETWDTDNIIYADDTSEDIGYPCTVELADGKLLTVYYAKNTCDSPAVIMQTIWSFEK